MSDIKRFAETAGNGNFSHFYEDEDGWLCYYDDHAAIVAQLEADLAEARKDQARLDWLESQCVEVRTPLLHGSLAKFHAQQISDDCEPHKTDLRAQVDAAIKEQGK